MIVGKPQYSATLKITYDVFENWRGMENYMGRNNWNTITCGISGIHCCTIFSKDFTTINTMEKEIEDIKDAFNIKNQ